MGEDGSVCKCKSVEMYELMQRSLSQYDSGRIMRNGKTENEGCLYGFRQWVEFGSLVYPWVRLWKPNLLTLTHLPEVSDIGVWQPATKDPQPRSIQPWRYEFHE